MALCFKTTDCHPVRAVVRAGRQSIVWTLPCARARSAARRSTIWSCAEMRRKKHRNAYTRRGIEVDLSAGRICRPSRRAGRSSAAGRSRQVGNSPCPPAGGASATRRSCRENGPCRPERIHSAESGSCRSCSSSSPAQRRAAALASSSGILSRLFFMPGISCANAGGKRNFAFMSCNSGLQSLIL